MIPDSLQVSIFNSEYITSYIFWFQSNQVQLYFFSLTEYYFY